ncbi:hypothetical protein EH372_12510 [Enterococcus faecium]|nr:hypothetical protein [Enterococcus faecium]
MKNVFLVCVIVALGGAVIYTFTEISKLNDQLESMQIANDQLQRKLEESSSTTAQIMQDSKELYSGTYEINPDTVQAATDSQSIADYKELSNIIRNNPDRKQQMQALQSAAFSSVDVDSVRTSLINEAMKDNISDEEYNALAQRILKQCELSAGQGEQ